MQAADTEVRRVDYQVVTPAGLEWDKITEFMYMVATQDEESMADALDKVTQLDVSTRAESGRSVLHIARTPSVMAMLIDAGAPLNSADEMGNTALKYWAAMSRVAKQGRLPEEFREEESAFLASALGVTEVLFVRGAELHTGWCRDDLWDASTYVSLEEKRAEYIACAITGDGPAAAVGGEGSAD